MTLAKQVKAEVKLHTREWPQLPYLALHECALQHYYLSSQRIAKYNKYDGGVAFSSSRKAQAL